MITFNYFLFFLLLLWAFSFGLFTGYTAFYQEPLPNSVIQTNTNFVIQTPDGKKIEVPSNSYIFLPGELFIPNENL
jgi:hypothetical protein